MATWVILSTKWNLGNRRFQFQSNLNYKSKLIKSK